MDENNRRQDEGQQGLDNLKRDRVRCGLGMARGDGVHNYVD